MSQTEKQSQVEAQSSVSGATEGSPHPAPVNRIYVGRLPCGCAVAACLDPDDVAEMAGNGYLIETVDATTVEIGGCRCATPREAAINALPDELIARAKAELEEYQWFQDLKTNADEDKYIFALALEMQEEERLGAVVAQTTRLDTLKSAEQVRENLFPIEHPPLRSCSEQD